MGSGCFHHFRHLNTGSFPLLTQSLFLELPLSLCACPQTEMFYKIIERKEGHAAPSIQVMPSALPAQSWLQTLAGGPSEPPSPTLYCGQACIIQGFSPSLLIMAFCKCPVLFLFLNQVFLYVFLIRTLI